MRDSLATELFPGGLLQLYQEMETALYLELILRSRKSQGLQG